MKQNWLGILIITLGVLGASYTMSRFFLNLRMEKDIEVKGYAELPVKSDRGSFGISVSVRGATIVEAHTLLNTAASEVAEWMGRNSPAKAEVGRTIPRVTPVYTKNKDGIDTSAVDFYAGQTTYSLTSTDVAGVDKLAGAVGELLEKGLEVSFAGPSYTIVDIEQYKKELIKKATEAGRARAELMAKTAGGKLGRLTAARQGVIQINAPTSTEDNEYGSYDTSTIDKVIKAPVTLSFRIE